MSDPKSRYRVSLSWLSASLVFMLSCSPGLSLKAGRNLDLRGQAKSSGCDESGLDTTHANCAVSGNTSANALPMPSVDPPIDSLPVNEPVKIEDTKPVSQEQLLEKIQPLSDEAAVKFFLNNCLSCHDAKQGSVASFWAMDKDLFSKQSLSADPLAPTIFATLLFKAKDIVGSKPAAMPLAKLSPELNAQILSAMKWMVNEFPVVVQDAQLLLSGSEAIKNLGAGTAVIMNYKCTEPATLREYTRRLVNDAFSREPSPEEFKLGTGSLDAAVTVDDRMKLSARILSNPIWKLEFEDKTLRKFASKIAGSAAIKPFDGMLTELQANDLKDEFYQLLKSSYDKISYKDLLLGSRVMVSANTAGLYGCMAPASGWTPCTMQAPRESFFTSIGYLRSKPSSFLSGNNNYGRAAIMHFVIKGDVLKPGFDEENASGNINPLPACLKTKDFRGQRGTAIAWRGSASVPLSANLCQSCHISRNMAAGSILFRPFNLAGLIYGSQVKLDASDPDFAAATAADMVVQPGMTGPIQTVSSAFLQSLLAKDGTEEACVDAVNAGGSDIALKSVKDLATYMIADGRPLSGGLARHLPRALSNLPSTTEEIIVKVNKASTDSKGFLAPMITAYFSSETYACKR